MYNTCTIQELKANYELNIITIFISLVLVTSLPSLMYRLIQPFTCEALLSHGPEICSMKIFFISHNPMLKNSNKPLQFGKCVKTWVIKDAYITY